MTPWLRSYCFKGKKQGLGMSVFHFIDFLTVSTTDKAQKDPRAQSTVMWQVLKDHLVCGNFTFFHY